MMTKKSKQPYHHILISKNTVDLVTVCVDSGSGEGGFDYWRVDKTGHSRVGGVIGDHLMQTYWIDYVDIKIIRNVNNVLDFYVKLEDNVTEINSTEFCADDIPF